MHNIVSHTKINVPSESRLMNGLHYCDINHAVKPNLRFLCCSSVPMCSSGNVLTRLEHNEPFAIETVSKQSQLVCQQVKKGVKNCCSNLRCTTKTFVINLIIHK